MDLMDRIMELSGYGYCCSQVLARLLLETMGEENEGFVKAMAGLNAGVGFSGGCCGCMTAGVCILSYVTGKGACDESEHPEHKSALGEFIQWFTYEMTAEYGGCDCRDIVKGNPANRLRFCPQIMADTYAKCLELLTERELI